MINQSKTQPRCAPTAPDNSELFFGLDTLSFFHVEPTVVSVSGDISKRPNVRCRTGGWREAPADEENCDWPSSVFRLAPIPFHEAR
jgi:hypothetical protein